MTNFKSILTDLGYKLNDRGSYWQTAAVFREGDNETALKIYKDSGVWVDFVNGEKAFPFELLLKKTLKKEDVSSIMKKSNSGFHTKERLLLKEEKTYSKLCLVKLLPDYDFYVNRNIPISVQKKFRCGVSTGGKLYNRVVFPIFREDGRIHGFSGRQLFGKDPKWLHYGGNTKHWFYPYFSVDGVKESIKKDKRVFLVESIGDCMALNRAGIENVIVAFTNNISAQLVGRLAGLDAEIHLAFNNDQEKESNRGFDGATRATLKLLDSVDFENLRFSPPQRGDFGDLSNDEINDWLLTVDETSHKDSWKTLLDYLPDSKLPKTVKANARKIKKEWRFLYEGV